MEFQKYPLMNHEATLIPKKRISLQTFQSNNRIPYISCGITNKGLRLTLKRESGVLVYQKIAINPQL